MSKRRSIIGSTAVLALVLGAAAWSVGHEPRRAAAANEPARLPTEDPANFTPNVLDGEVDSIWQIGSRVFIGGTFDQVADATQNGGTVHPRDGLAAFSATTGLVDPSFAPTIDGSVNVVIPSADGQTIYIGGSFDTVNGQSRSRIAQLDVTDGSLTAFDVDGVTGTVRDLRLVERGAVDQLIVAGAFTHLDGAERPALASLNATTGAVTGFLDLDVTGTHNGGTTIVFKVDVTPDGQRMIMIGNFTTISGLERYQVGVVDLSTNPASVSAWDTEFYEDPCGGAFDSYMRDVDISPDGTYAVITTTGGYTAGAACDTIARVQLTSAVAAVEPTWVAYTGGDTTYAVEIHDNVAYIGGHMRWLNNPSAGNNPGQGAVPREGMAALDVETGLPYSWNPTRDRGVGVFDYHVTAAGLWGGSDTQRWNGELRQRLAFFPWAGGTVVPARDIGALPGNVLLLGRTTGTVAADPSVLHRVNAGGPALPSVDDGPDWSADTNAAPSPFRAAGGGNVTTQASWSVGEMDPSVPASDVDRPPAGLWRTERWDPPAAPEMAWAFPVAAGTPVQVRLFLGNKSVNTDEPGQRRFDVEVDGDVVAPDIDLAIDPGHNVGTMLAFDVVSDGTINIEFLHDVENPLVNGIEIVRTDASGVGTLGTQDQIRTIGYDGVNPPVAGAPAAGTRPWRTVRGAFAVGSTAFTVHVDGTIVARQFDGGAFSGDQALPTYGGSFLGDAATMTGLVYDPTTARLLYTLDGDPNLYARSFLPESGVVDASRTTVTGPGVTALAPGRVQGMFLANGRVWFVDEGSGNLLSIALAGGVPTGAVSVADTSVDWRARALLLDGGAALPPPPTTTTAPPPPTTTVPGGGGGGGGGGAGQFRAVSPQRVFDTRPGGTAGSLREVPGVKVGGSNVLTVGFADLPGVTPAGGVAAVSLNVAVTNPEADGYVTVYPCGPRELVASVNYTAGQTVSNAVIAPVSASGELCFFSLVPTDIVVDINGWLPAGSGFTAVAPKRVFDTRPGESPAALRDVQRVQVGPGAPLEVQVTDLPGTTPSGGVGAVSINLAVTNPVAPGFVTVYPCGERREVASANYIAGQTVSNAVIAPVSPAGTICFFALQPTDLVVDVNGWFATGGGFVPTGPARVLDTRPGQSPGALLDVARTKVSGANVLRVRVTDLPGTTPAGGVGAVSLNVTATNTEAAGFVTVYPCDVRREVASVNHGAGQTVPNAVIAPVGAGGEICFYSLAPVDLVVDINGWFPA